MPHITFQMFPGRPEEVKRALAEKLHATTVEALGCSPEVVSVSIEEIAPDDWNGRVPDIIPEEQVFIGPIYRK